MRVDGIMWSAKLVGRVDDMLEGVDRDDTEALMVALGFGAWGTCTNREGDRYSSLSSRLCYLRWDTDSQTWAENREHPDSEWHFVTWGGAHKLKPMDVEAEKRRMSDLRNKIEELKGTRGNG